MSSVLITGILKDAFGAPIPNYEFFFEAIRTSDTLLNTTNAKFTTSGTGSYSFTLEYGTYTLKAKPQRDPQFKTIASNILVYSQGLTNKDIQYLLTSQADLEAVDQTILEAVLQVKADILNALTFSVVDKGNVSLASGIYPTPESNGQGGYFSSLWYVTTGGTVSGVVFTAGDQLLYSATAAAYRKIDNTYLVSSVNGMVGTVVVTTITGNAGTATTLQTARTIGVSGDGTGTATSFNGSANITIPFTLATVATAGTYRSVTVDAKGRVTSGTNPTTLAGYGITDAQPLDAELTAFAGLSTNGIVVKTAAGTATTRSVSVSGTGLSVSNADGVSGNPTITSNATNLNTVSTIVARDASGNFAAGTITAALSGNATTATTLATARSISITGDGTWTTSFNGGSNATAAFTLANSGVTAGTYANVVVDVKGRVTSGGNAPTIVGGSINNTPIGATTVSTGAFSTITSTGNTTVGGVLTVTGNLIVNGTTTTVNSTTVTLDDPILTLGGDTAPASMDGKDRGIEFRWHNGTAAKVGFFGFDSSTGNLTYIPDATNTSEVFTGSVGTITANILGAVTGNASTATALATTRTLATSGDVSGSVAFDGTANVTIPTALSNTGVTAGTYRSVTVDAKGRVTAATNPTTLAGYGITDASPLVGSTSIVTVGTIATGTWNATNIAVGKGGTGTSTAPTQGGIIFGSSTSAYGSTAAGTSGQILTSAGTGTPTWGFLDLATHAPDLSFKKICRVATTDDLGASSFGSDVLTGYDDTLSLACTTTAASTSITTTSTAGIKVGAVISTATVQIAAGTSIAGITSATVFTVNNRAAISTTAITGTGTTATATFAAQTYAPYAVGSSIVITGATPTTYNGTFVVTACTTTSVSWASTTSTTATVQGVINFTIAAGTSITTAFAQSISALVIDGVTLAVNDRVLVKDQRTIGSLILTDAAKYNGIYYVSATGSTTTPWTLTRSLDANPGTDIDGAIVNVSVGTTNFGKSYKTRFSGTSTINTTPMYWGRIADVNSSSLAASPVTAVGVDLATDPETVMFASTGTIADFAVSSVGIKTVQATAATTYTRASSMYIAGAPVASTNTTITTPYALYVAGGNNYMAGNLTVGGTLALTGNATFTGDVAVNGGDLTTSATTMNIVTATATTLNIGSAATTFNTATTTATSTMNLATGATLSGATKTINIGTAGLSGSITNIDIGSSVSGSLGTINLNNDVIVTTTGYLALPDGTTAQRPASPTNGMSRYNTDTDTMEYYRENAWVPSSYVNGGYSLRNKIVDGRFDFWYEGVSQTTSGYGSDTMWVNAQVGGSKVHTRQLLTAGADLPAIEVPSTKYFSRTVVTSVAGASNQVRKYQVIEDVRTLAGKTVTVSFYAKADAAKNIALSFEQNFGLGGSTTVLVAVGLVPLTTTWARYSRTVTLPSVSGKTIGADNNALVFSLWFDAGSAYNGVASSLGQRSGTYDICCVQVEEGSIATPFEELPPEISESRVNRYYEEGINALIGSAAGAGYFVGTRIPFRQIKRCIPTITYGTPTEYVNIGTFNQTVDIVTIRQWVLANEAGNAYISRNFVADARL